MTPKRGTLLGFALVAAGCIAVLGACRRQEPDNAPIPWANHEVAEYKMKEQAHVEWLKSLDRDYVIKNQNRLLGKYFVSLPRELQDERHSPPGLGPQKGDPWGPDYRAGDSTEQPAWTTRQRAYASPPGNPQDSRRQPGAAQTKRPKADNQGLSNSANWSPASEYEPVTTNYMPLVLGTLVPAVLMLTVIYVWMRIRERAATWEGTGTP